MKKFIFVMCCLVWADMALAKCGNNDENRLCEPKSGSIVQPGSTTMVGWSRSPGMDKISVEWTYATTDFSIAPTGVVQGSASYAEGWEWGTTPYEMDQGIYLDCKAFGTLTITVKWWKKKFASGDYRSDPEKETTIILEIGVSIAPIPEVAGKLFCDTGTYSLSAPIREGYIVRWETMDGGEHLGQSLTQTYSSPGVYGVNYQYLPEDWASRKCPMISPKGKTSVTIAPSMEFFPLYRQERVIATIDDDGHVPCADPSPPFATPLGTLWQVFDFIIELQQALNSVNDGLPASNTYHLYRKDKIHYQWTPLDKIVFDINGMPWSCFEDVYPEPNQMVDYYYQAMVSFVLNGYLKPIEQNGLENNEIESTVYGDCAVTLEWIRVKAYKIANDSLPIDTSILGDILHDFPEHCDLTQVLVAEAGQGLDLGPEVRGKALETQYAWQGDLLGYTTEQVHLNPSEMDFTHDNGWSALYELSIKEPNRELTYCSKVVRPGIFNASTNKTMQTRSHAMDAATGLNVYPNPASNRLWFELHEKASIHIFSLEGKLMHQAEWNMGKHELSTEDWPAGIYVLQWNNGLTQQAEPLIIQH